MFAGQRHHCERISAAIRRLGYPAPEMGERDDTALDKIATCLETIAGAMESEPEGEDDPSCRSCGGTGEGSGMGNCSSCRGSGLDKEFR